METKYCTKCEEYKLKSEFNKRTRNKDGLQSYCRTCNSSISKSYYSKNTEKVKSKASRGRVRRQKWLQQQKIGSNCRDCGINHDQEPWLMEFDHIKGNKVGNVGQLLHARSKSQVEFEISKCELVCILCHRRRTAKRGSWKVL